MGAIDKNNAERYPYLSRQLAEPGSAPPRKADI